MIENGLALGIGLYGRFDGVRQLPLSRARHSGLLIAWRGSAVDLRDQQRQARRGSTEQGRPGRTLQVEIPRPLLPCRR